MQFEDLSEYDVPETLINLWGGHYDALLDVQHKAVEAGLLDGQSLLVTAPTSSGKTLIGEMAIVVRAMQNLPGLYLAPTKALAEAKYSRLQETYEPLGLRTGICTRDRSTDDRLIACGDCDIAVAIPEKIQALLGGSGAAVGELFGTVVVDEIQLLQDAARGDCLEMLLAPIIGSAGLQIVGLSAALPEADDVSEWLRTRHIRSSARPVKLRIGVLDGSTFRYREQPDGLVDTENLSIDAPPAGLDRDLGLLVSAASGPPAEESALVFVRDRATAVRAADEIAQRRSKTGAPRSLQALESLCPTAVRMRLKRLLEKRVAFHTTDLQFSDRQIIERGFAEDDIDVLVSTSTLAEGVNLPARNVIIDPYVWRAAPHSQMENFYRLRTMTPAQMHTRAGRAGRLHCGDEFGRAIIPASGSAQAEALWRRYSTIGTTPPRFSSHHPPKDPRQRLMRICVAFEVPGRAELSDAVNRTFGGLPGGADPGETADRCVQLGLLRRRADGAHIPTRLGRSFAISQVSLESFMRLVEFARQNPRPDPWDALVMCCTLDEADSENPFSAPDGDEPDSRNELLQRASSRETTSWWTPRTIVGILSDRDTPLRRRKRAATLAVAMLDWISPLSSHRLERHTGQPCARLQAAGKCVAWLMRVLGVIYETLEPSEPTTGRLAPAGPQMETLLMKVRRFADRCNHGLTAAALPLASLEMAAIDRDHLHALAAEGYTRPAAIVKAGVEELGEVVPEPVARGIHTAARERLFHTVRSANKESKDPFADEMAPPQSVLHLDADRPFEAAVCGRIVELSPTEFRMLIELAENVGTCVEYERIYGRMWEGEEFIHPSQLYTHRSRLARKLQEAAEKSRDFTPPEQLMVTVRNTGIMLDLEPQQVSVEVGDSS